MAMFSEPNKLPQPFAANGDKNTIPNTNDGSDGLASYALGFPEITSEPLEAGGIPPERGDFNGILNTFSQFLMFIQNGGIFSYDSTLDYSRGAFVSYSGKIWICTTNNGASNPQTPSDGMYWQEVKGNVFTGATANVAGAKGLVPPPPQGSQASLLSGAGVFVDTAPKALSDGSGNNIVATYQTKADTTQAKILEAVGSISVANRNGIWRGKNLGTLSSEAETTTIFNQHGIPSNLFTDVFIGDYFYIPDGTYNKNWVILGINTYYGKGDAAFNTPHIVVAPTSPLMSIGMNATNTTSGGYKGSRMWTETLPAIATTLRGVLGSHLKTRRSIISNSVNTSQASGAGAGWVGCSNGWEWVDCPITLMNEVEVYGTRVLSSSFYDVGEKCEKLPAFNFKNHIEIFGRNWFWLSAVASGTNFCAASDDGVAGISDASGSYAVFPLICLG